jgi:hypothetical protein
MKRSRLKRSRVVELTLVSSMAAMLIGCRDRPTQYCVDESQAVVDEKNCVAGNGGYHYYYGGGHGFMPYGTRLSGGSTTAPSEGYTTASGTVRGGIGGAGEAASGGHGGGGDGAGE